MGPRNSQTVKHRRTPLRSVLLIAALALAIGAAIMLVNQSRYFQLKPATGTAAALSQAATPTEGQAAKP